MIAAFVAATEASEKDCRHCSNRPHRWAAMIGGQRDACWSSHIAGSVPSGAGVGGRPTPEAVLEKWPVRSPWKVKCSSVEASCMPTLLASLDAHHKSATDASLSAHGNSEPAKTSPWNHYSVCDVLSMVVALVTHTALQNRHAL